MYTYPKNIEIPNMYIERVIKPNTGVSGVYNVNIRGKCHKLQHILSARIPSFLPNLSKNISCKNPLQPYSSPKKGI